MGGILEIKDYSTPVVSTVVTGVSPDGSADIRSSTTIVISITGLSRPLTTETLIELVGKYLQF